MSQLVKHELLALSLSNNNSDETETEYRSIGEVVGGLHGGKYQFTGGGGGSSFESSFGGEGSCGENDNNEEESDEEMPNWARKMLPPSTSESSLSLLDVETLNIPSNANPMDGMTYSTTISIKNEERTWEKFYAKIIFCQGDGDQCSISDSDSVRKPFYVKPKNGFLAPRGGASNACDASNPYSDSAKLHIIHNSNETVDLPPQGSQGQWWLVAGTEEEKWYYKLALEDL